mgnify:CR=1 FL=1
MGISNTFEIHGYTIDVYVKEKFKGSYSIKNPDREVFGRKGRKTHTLSEDVYVRWKKKPIKSGTEVQTECSPVCGRMIKTIEDEK